MIIMNIAEWIVNFIAFGFGLVVVTGGLFFALMIITLVADRYNKGKY